MVVKPQLLWVDLEMTGLNVLHDRIIEVAALLTDYALTPVPNSSFHRIMHCEESILSDMDEWCTRTHGNSGLTESVKRSKYTIEGVQEELLAHLKSFGCQERTLLLSGNSIHADRMFLTLQMPALTSFLHYRQIDVSTIKSLAQNCNRKVSESVPKKQEGHRAMDDILESIAELRHYKETWLKSDFNI